MSKTLEELAQEKIAAAETAKRVALEQEDERKRKAAERRQRFDLRLGSIEAGASQLCTPATHVKLDRGSNGLTFRFGTGALELDLHDLDDADVDFWGSLRVQRAAWSFYFAPDGSFAWVRFKRNPMVGGDGLELSPSNDAQFRDFMRGARITHTVCVERTGGTLADMLKEAIAKLIQLSSV
jgi:hypothetical protein